MLMQYQYSDRIKDIRPSAIREILKYAATHPGVIALSTGSPSDEAVPVEEIREITEWIFKEMPLAGLQYSMTEGYPALRESTKKRLKEAFNIGKDFDDLIITTGGQQGLSLAPNVLCNPGDTVIVEAPTFVSGINAMRIHGANVVGIEMDDEGMDLEKLKKAIETEPNVKMLYLIPTFQNPSGKTMSLARRKAIYELCVKHGIIILEDNPYGELRFRGEDIPTFKSMDEEGIVIYNGSYSKVLSAGMRIGFIMAEKELLQRLTVAKQFSDCHTNIFFQIVTDRWLRTADVNAHIEKIRKIYRERCDFMLDLLDKHMDKRVTWTRPDGGLFLWCTLPEGCDSQELSEIALEKGVAFVPGRDFMVDSNAPCRDFRLNFSTPSYENMEKGILRLAEAVNEYLAKH
jgi:2-aminoadipate transaminase